MWRRGGRGAEVIRTITAIAKALSPGGKDTVSGLVVPGGLPVGRITGVIGALGEAAESWLTRRSQQAALLRLSTDGRPRRVRDVEDPIRLGIHPAVELRDAIDRSQRLPPFIRRDITEQLETSVKRGSGFVLLVGESTAGKTRSAYEAMRKLLPDYRLVLPDSRQALVSLHPQICRSRRIVVWLDELDRYLGIDGLTPRMVEQMTARQAHRILILATMSAAAHSRFKTQGVVEETDNDLARNARQILDMADTFRLARVWSDAEVSLARTYGSDPRIEAAIRHAHARRRGVAEYLAAAPDLLSAWDSAWESGTHPRGAALIAAAVDVRRAGYHQALPVSLIEQLHTHYLDVRGGVALRPEPLDQAWDWATKPLHATSSLLLPKKNGTYLAFDYLHDSLDAQRPPRRIPEWTWHALVEHVDAVGAFDVGIATLAHGDLEHASTALQKAVRLGESRARLPHARSVCDAGEPQRATALYAELIEESTRQHGPDSEETFLYRLGHDRTIGESGHYVEAVRLFQKLITDSAAIFAPGHRYRFSARIQHAYYTGLAGDPRRAVELFDDMLGELRASLGAEHSYTLNARFAHAFFVGEAGRPARAAALFERLVADRTRLQGPYARYTLNNRRHHAHFLGESGQAAKAAQLFGQLTGDCVAVFGATHPDALASRYGEARFIGEAGDPERAVGLFKDLLDDEERMRVHEPDSPITFLHRRHHARFVGEAGNPRQAERLLKALASDTRRALGQHHPERFAVRIAIARFTGMSGRFEAACSLYERLAIECEQRLGQDHPLTLAARNGHARFLGDTGQYAQAAELFELIYIEGYAERVLIVNQ